MKLAEVAADVHLARGSLEVSPHSAQLYGGTIRLEGSTMGGLKAILALPGPR